MLNHNLEMVFFFKIQSVTFLKFSLKVGPCGKFCFVVMHKLVVSFKIEAVHTKKSCNLSKLTGSLS